MNNQVQCFLWDSSAHFISPSTLHFYTTCLLTSPLIWFVFCGKSFALVTVWFCRSRSGSTGSSANVRHIHIFDLLCRCFCLPFFLLIFHFNFILAQLDKPYTTIYATWAENHIRFTMQAAACQVLQTLYSIFTVYLYLVLHNPTSSLLKHFHISQSWTVLLFSSSTLFLLLLLSYFFKTNVCLKYAAMWSSFTHFWLISIMHYHQGGVWNSLCSMTTSPNILSEP